MLFILIIFIFEYKFKFKIKNNFIENEILYKILWLTGIIGFTIGTLIIPFLNHLDFLWDFV